LIYGQGMTDVDTARFEQAWTRFAGWLAVNSPADRAALRAPATEEQVAALERHLGFPLHPEVRALLARHDGVPELRAGAPGEPFAVQAGAFLPSGHRLNGVARIISEHRMFTEVFEEDAEDPEDWAEEPLIAHAEMWVPIAHPNDGGLVFVDHCPGPTFGEVYEMGVGSGDIEGHRWAGSLAEFFEALADGLEGGERFRYYRPAMAEDSAGTRCLEWRVEV